MGLEAVALMITDPTRSKVWMEVRSQGQSGATDAIYPGGYLEDEDVRKRRWQCYRAAAKRGFRQETAGQAALERFHRILTRGVISDQGTIVIPFHGVNFSGSLPDFLNTGNLQNRLIWEEITNVAESNNSSVRLLTAVLVKHLQYCP